MNYLISMFDAVIVGGKNQNIYSKVKYKIKSTESSGCVVFPKCQGAPFIFNLGDGSTNVLKVKFSNDNFYFLFLERLENTHCALVKYKNKDMFISASNHLSIMYDGELICEKNVDKIKFLHSEIVGDLCLLFFTGERDFLCVIKNAEVLFCDYYDECNISDKEKYFMCKLNDSLNHGKVCEIKDNALSQYLVYLDDNELNLKDNFVSFVFLDCVFAGNYKYCNALLSEDLKMKNETEIKEFFPEFDFYYPLKENVFALIKKNTLAGIFEFEIKNLCITNIKQI